LEEKLLLLFEGYKHAGRLKETKQEPICRGLRIEDTQERYQRYKRGKAARKIEEG
jgi:hypothetical protein